MVTNINCSQINRPRAAGVLLHPTSLPGTLGNGDIGHEAYRFIEFLHACRFKVWQMLPLGPTHDDNSPYQCLSAHAGNPSLISLDWLVDKGWLDRDKIKLKPTDEDYRSSCLEFSADYFYQLNDLFWEKSIHKFSEEHTAWLPDYALFMAFKKRYNNKPWYDWPVPVRQRDNDVLNAARQDLEPAIKQIIFEQFIFFTQWYEIRDYAKQHGVELFGDMPIFVARDSADVWARRENFLIDSNGEMEFVAGVPPDAFTDKGQRWGNPLYDWQQLQATDFSWWKERFDTQLKLFDLLRVDHFRGLQACWHIPQADETAINGSWVEVPGRALLNELFETFHSLPLVAEDLGVITEQVTELRNDFNLPGMKVLQFAFDANNTNPHLPHNHKTNDVVYTGTHDNDTTLGWVNNENNYNKAYFEEYINSKIESPEQASWLMIRLAMSSVSFLCVLPMQDVLMLDSSARMNIPGTVTNNWQWRFEWQQLRPEINEKLSRLITLYQR